MKQRTIFYAFWIPLAIAALCGIMALAKVGYPAEWPFWYFPAIAFSPSVAIFLFMVAKILLIDSVPPKFPSGEYKYHAVQCGVEKPLRVWVWSREAREFRKWYHNFLKETKKNRQS